ncbi:hypothetical protein [Mucilaginibacter sp. BT774]|uniref:hypothetical protein n=1 Tax=Mucilaginibacter sp. BT774 TaxID=3062276 RepID=UPI002675EF17|nr:hypothetical protein [Mucilaginibacter sp. BT774]MDO3625829.1 hypothetical protein [Mucilaginibacter sp. BT774]
MIPKIYKPALFVAALLATVQPVLAQDTADSTSSSGFDSELFNKSMKTLNMKVNVDTKHLELTMEKLGRKLDYSFRDLDNNLHIDHLVSDITSTVNDAVHSVTLSVSGDDNEGSTNISISSPQERVKNYSKSYAVDGNDKLSLDNKYGRVTVNTWSKNEVKVDVQIKGTASDDETAQKLVDAITISDSKDGNVVSFRTNFGSGNSSMWNLFSNMNDRHRAEVNYTVYMPSTMSLDLRNKYGSVALPSLSGKVTIDNAYGSLVAKALTNPSNEFNFHYYEVNIEEVKGCDLNLSYGSLKLGTVGRLDANVNYAPIDIEKLNISGTINARYGGGVKIGEISKALKNLDIDSKYSSVNIGLRGDESFDFDVTVKYGSFNFDDNRLKITSKSPSDDSRGYHPTKNYKGYAGNGNSNNKISINTTYQSVKLE